MTHLPAHSTKVLCVLGVLAIAGCAPRGIAASAPTTAPTSAVVPVGVTSTAAPSTPPVAPDDSAVVQQLTTINNQLSTISGQLNAASAGLSTSEGNPAQ